jgi:hypothetical protein
VDVKKINLNDTDKKKEIQNEDIIQSGFMTNILVAINHWDMDNVRKKTKK